MQTKLRIFLTLLAFPAGSVLATEPASPQTGRVLVLDNERALEGDIRRETGCYRVKRATGEMWLAEDKVLALCANWDEAFAFVRSRANLRDPDERLRLARWCQTYGLRTQALGEATAALQMRPAHGPSRQLVTLLEREDSSPPKAIVAASKASPSANSVQPAIDVSTESVGLFTTRVQPVLMNTCASCHAGGKPTAFRLTRVSASSSGARGTTQQNLASVLAQIDPRHPNASPLLMRAITDHGKAGQAPIKAQSPPYRVLQEWIHVTIAGNPFLKEQAEAVAAAPATASRASGEAFAQEPQRARSISAPDLTTAARRPEAPVISRTAGEANESPAIAQAAAAPAAPATSLDDFDPAPFNRQFHQENRAAASPGRGGRE